mmetsp:Transcript_54341/g.151345  ORF Transcript_54341/g.151345 Transcript_54341/m.151345 type:complete len:219 (+) Transcript_54341:1364-2020(+)
MVACWRKIRDCSLLTKTGCATQRMVDAFLANLSVDKLSSTESDEGFKVTSKPVLEFPPRCTASKRVKLESLTGKYSPRTQVECGELSGAEWSEPRRSPPASFSITFPKKKSDLLMELDSATYSEDASTRSFPARSTKTRRPSWVTQGASSDAPEAPLPLGEGCRTGSEHSMIRVISVCDREETSLNRVPATRRRLSAVASKETTSSTEDTGRSRRPST